MRIVLSLIALMLALASAPALHADGPVALQVSLDHAKVRLGDPVALRLTVTHTTQTSLIFPEPAVFEKLGLEVQPGPPKASPVSPDVVKTAMEYKLIGFTPKIYVFLPAMLGVSYQSGGARGVVTVADPIALEVQSVLGGQINQPLRGIRPPVELAEPSLLERATTPAGLLALVAGVLALMAAALAVWWLRRPQAAITPEQRAREALHAASVMLNKPAPDYDAFYTALVVAVRIYLTERAEFPALTSTTRDLRGYMALAGTEQQQASLILKLMQECDTVRWAHIYPQLDGATSALGLAYQIIDVVAAEKAAIPSEPSQPGTLSPAGAH